ncbi:efflux RND transporter periplasmic adaptor subunit [Yeosuana sp. MJ-SS3]|uniref:Efflux RND transporter periplasmic adaptor subunit n=1 Tax=Gilvirhabdus luticola TaxID=3079858 RepID=A0ABU3U5U6_9FLAO|nr:efflux RND transporter periplasmic adaptor subunit [Yeosuana sp. MJ-SS3]MDU8885689.1 efflux RND transporter periplasmic adaptor subunit [Yeosuana sp. MJ-SS3]
MKIFKILILTVLITSCSNRLDGILPTARSLTESVYSSVTIQPDSMYQAYAIVAGILEANMVEEGDTVSIGDPLVQIINSTSKLNAQTAKLALDLARENYNGKATILMGIQDQINTAILKYKNDSLNYFRQKKLWEQNIGSRIDYDTKKLNYDLASNNLLTLNNNYQRTKNELQTLVKQSENNYRAALIGSKDFTVKSKINGKVYALYKEPGEIVSSMDPLVSIGSASDFLVEMLVDEVDIVKIKVGQNVLIHLDAYYGEVFNGVVSKIYPEKDQRNQTFKIEAVFIKPPQVLYPGLSGEANIVISKKESVLVIPKAYLIDGNKVITNEGLVTVTLGIQNMKDIEVQSGLTGDTYIYKPSND